MPFWQLKQFQKYLKTIEKSLKQFSVSGHNSEPSQSDLTHSQLFSERVETLSKSHCTENSFRLFPRDEWLKSPRPWYFLVIRDSTYSSRGS
jgi:hypothetical protein